MVEEVYTHARKKDTHEVCCHQCSLQKLEFWVALGGGCFGERGTELIVAIRVAHAQAATLSRTWVTGIPEACHGWPCATECGQPLSRSVQQQIANKDLDELSAS
eukprot:6251948-Amphidinium_carterae.1